MDNRFYVYSYSTEQDGVFWIGKGCGGRIYAPHKKTVKCYNLLEKRRKQEIKVTKKKIYTDMCEKEAFAWEVYLIDFYKPKCNLTKGGEGISGYKHTDEAKQKISDIGKGRVVSLETRERMSKAQSGRTLSAEARTSISRSKSRENNPNWGKPRTEETKEKIRAGNVGKVRTEETKKKMSAAKMGANNRLWGKERNPETKKKIGIANKGKKRTAETKRRIGASKAGENSPSAKLTWEKVEKIREMYFMESCSVETLEALSKENGVSVCSVRDVIANRTWKIPLKENNNKEKQ